MLSSNRRIVEWLIGVEERFNEKLGRALFRKMLYVDPAAEDIHTHLGTVAAPLNRLGSKTLCPGSSKLAAVNDEYR